jgi:hypothetical protein
LNAQAILLDVGIEKSPGQAGSMARSVAEEGVISVVQLSLSDQRADREFYRNASGESARHG